MPVAISGAAALRTRWFPIQRKNTGNASRGFVKAKNCIYQRHKVERVYSGNIGRSGSDLSRSDRQKQP